MKTKIICPKCKSIINIRKGYRHTKIGLRAIYLCKICGKKFTPCLISRAVSGEYGIYDNNITRMRFNYTIIFHAVELYRNLKSLSKVQQDLKRMDDVVVSRVTIGKWVKRFNRLVPSNWLKSPILNTSDKMDFQIEIKERYKQWYG